LNVSFRKMKEFERMVKAEMESKGFSVFPLRKSIVNFIAEDKEISYFGGIEEEASRIRKKVEYLKEFYELSNKDGILIVKKESEASGNSEVPIISYSELSKVKDNQEFKEILRERRVD